jgi:hypothetical protein
LSTIVVVVAVAAAALSYQLLNQQSASQPSAVIWRDSSGNLITSITLTYSASGANSKIVSFTCYPSLNSVTLSLSIGLQPRVTVSPPNFPSCNSTPNTVTLTVSPPNSNTITGELRVLASTSPETLAAISGTLSIQVLAS